MKMVRNRASASIREQRREMIIRAAREEFFEHGYAAASMSRIAARLGGSKGRLYTYFRSKKELFEAQIAEICNGARNSFIRIDSEGLVRDTLMTVGEVHLKYLYAAQTLNLARILIAEAGMTTHLGRHFYGVGLAQRREDLAKYLLSAQARGFIRRDADCSSAADQFLTLCENPPHLQLLLNLISSPTPVEIRRQVGQAVLVFTRIFSPTRDVTRKLPRSIDTVVIGPND